MIKYGKYDYIEEARHDNIILSLGIGMMVVMALALIIGIWIGRLL